MSTRLVPDNHPFKNKVGEALFDLVFGHLAPDVLAVKVEEEKAARAEAAKTLGEDPVLNSIHFDGVKEKLVFGYERKS